MSPARLRVWVSSPRPSPSSPSSARGRSSGSRSGRIVGDYSGGVLESDPQHRLEPRHLRGLLVRAQPHGDVELVVLASALPSFRTLTRIVVEHAARSGDGKSMDTTWRSADMADSFVGSLSCAAAPRAASSARRGPNCLATAVVRSSQIAVRKRSWLHASRTARATGERPASPPVISVAGLPIHVPVGRGGSRTP
jgi:hypothetical protein